MCSHDNLENDYEVCPLGLFGKNAALSFFLDTIGFKVQLSVIHVLQDGLVSAQTASILSQLRPP